MSVQAVGVWRPLRGAGVWRQLKGMRLEKMPEPLAQECVCECVCGQLRGMRLEQMPDYWRKMSCGWVCGGS